MWGFSRWGFPGLALGVPVTRGMKVGLKKTGVRGLAIGENCMILCSLVLTHYQRVMCCGIAEHDEKRTI